MIPSFTASGQNELRTTISACPFPASADSSAANAFAMHAALSKLNRRWSADGRPLFDIGIALNHGKAVVGDIGSPNKMEFTVIGDAVNVAWRLQERTKEHAGEIVIGDTVTAWIAGKIRTEPGGVIRVRDSIDVPDSIAHFSAEQRLMP